ncbi:MAG TPA: biotin--[acetyl-CoA-carboxylase] ligase [Novosphingobium sp.]|nr:biotin--[acetyl-CoA-carboxylase] ligase [Novosphingobium sp.]HZV08339.1 biotin--[acetyl-CoA-carboxylase] ligase [Novosphingobium sp.]
MISFFNEIDSTNAEWARRLAAGAPSVEGEWLVARRQTAGRGRLGRAWQDGAGNFMGSTLVRPGPGDPPPASLALLTGLAVAEAVAGHVPPPLAPLLKWPNDVLVNGAKLAGVLLEAQGDAVIVGVGVNLASAPLLEGRETVALADFAPPPALDHFAGQMAAAFAAQLASWRAHGLAALVARWQQAALPQGTPLGVTGADGQRIEGRFAGLAEDGAMRLRLADGAIRAIHAGDVALL